MDGSAIDMEKWLRDQNERMRLECGRARNAYREAERSRKILQDLLSEAQEKLKAYEAWLPRDCHFCKYIAEDLEQPGAAPHCEQCVEASHWEPGTPGGRSQGEE
jgi:rubrerythrin